MELEATMASLAKKYANRKSAKKETTGAIKQAPGDAPKSAAARPKDLPQNKVKASAEPNGDRGTDKPGSNGDTVDGLDEREMLRRQKKAEEARRKAEETKTPVTVGGKPRRPEDRAGNADQHHEPTSNTPKRRTTMSLTMMNLDGKSEQERAREERANDKLGKLPSKLYTLKNLAERLRNSDELLLRLKLHYMRTRSAEMVISFLYGNNIDGDYSFLFRFLS
jgi:hypothetical protein